ncbi:MAG TPA: hypothetical protein DIW31_05775 [Bacteroidales bacterium]|nr:hypothetical protein [Bacteroidales bacterium]
MIEVFETWFNQFTKEEQVKLLKHIRVHHFDLIEEETAIKYDRNEREAADMTKLSSNHKVKHVKV